MQYTVEGAGIPLLVLGSSIYYPRTFSSRLRESCTLICADLPHFVPLGAILMFEQSAITDPQIKQLCGQIIESQLAKIEQMQAILRRY